MGRITVFTADDVHSKQVLDALKARGLPFTEISVVKFPSKFADMHALTSKASVPQVFFNTRYVGGVDATIKELLRWDRPSARFRTPLERFKFEIESQPDPSSTRFFNPGTNPADASIIPRQKFSAMTISLPDGTKTSVLDMMEKLKNTLVTKELKFKGAVYMNCFTGASAVATFQQSLGCSSEAAVALGKKMVDANVFTPVEVTPFNDFDGSSQKIYRLQCDTTPDVLNSYCIWQEPSRRTVEDLMSDLDTSLREIENASMNAEGKLDYRKARSHEHYPYFEEAMCELQRISITNLSREEMMAFGINIYNLMMRYALLKVGVPVGETARLGLLNILKFNISGYEFTFNEWLHGVLRGNQKPRFQNKAVFGSKDPRKKFSVAKPDRRIHFAINIGYWMGSRASIPFANYTADNLDHELGVAASIFCEDERTVAIRAKKSEIKISKAFMWNREDFAKRDKDLLLELINYIQGTKRFALKKLLQQSKSVKIAYLDVDPTVNAVKFATFDKIAVQARVKGVKAVLRRFQPPKIPENELLRLSTLHSLNILETLPEERFDRLTRMVQASFNVPFVFISLVDADSPWFKSCQWACPFTEAPSSLEREKSFCGHTVAGPPDSLLECADLSQDDRFADNPLVADGMRFRYYFGYNISIPAVDGNGEKVNIGTLCVLDQKPRQFTKEEKKTFEEFTRLVKQEILRRDKEPPAFLQKELTTHSNEVVQSV